MKLDNEVNTYARGIRDHLWVVEQFSDIVDALNNFQTDSKKLPAEMKNRTA
jgi:hypothetical protein